MKWFKMGVIGVSLLISQVQAAELQLTIDTQTAADMICYVSCGITPIERKLEQRLWDTPIEYPCNELPAIGIDCKLIVLAATKASLENAIRNLQILTGQEINYGK